MITLGQLQGDIYEILQKSPTAPGLLTPNKVNAMIRDSLDYIATKMMKIGGGWLTKVVYCDVIGGSPYVKLPAGLAIINFVKFQSYGASQYVPIKFNENPDGSTDLTTSGVQGTIPMYRFSSGQLYLEPMINTSLAKAILIDGVFYPDELNSESDILSGDLDSRAFVNYAKWRSASALRALTSKDPAPWGQQETEWKQAAFEIIARRFREPTPINAFPR